MEKSAALSALAALAQETRLDIYRLLVRTGTNGLPAGQIAQAIGLPSATLAFHLKELRNAGLARYRREGRSLIYVAVYPTMVALLAYLTEACCQGDPAACGLPELRAGCAVSDDATAPHEAAPFEATTTGAAA